MAIVPVAHPAAVVTPTLVPHATATAAGSGVPAPDPVDPRLTFGMTEAAAGIVRDVDAAQQSIDAEFFALIPTGPGADIADALVRAAQRGVRVRLILAGLGNPLVGFAANLRPGLIDTAHVVRQLRQAGADVQITGLWRRAAPGRTMDHCKAVVIDGSNAWIGGMNFAAATSGWLDSMVRLGGAAGAAASGAQQLRWAQVTGAEPEVTGPLAASAAASAALSAQAGYQLLRNDPSTHDPAIMRWYVDQVNAAKQRVWVASPVVMDRTMRLALASAAQRGVDVRVYVAADSLRGIPGLHSVSEAFTASLTAAGAHVLDVHGFSHVKAMLVDDQAVTGSFNLTHRSEAADEELDVASSTTPFVGAVSGMFGQLAGMSDPAPKASALGRLLAGAVDRLHLQY